MKPAGPKHTHTHHFLAVFCFAELTAAALSLIIISNNYSGSKLTSFITLTPALLDKQVCSHSIVCICVYSSAAVERASESAESAENLQAAAGLFNPLTYGLLSTALISVPLLLFPMY